ncbi:putative transposase, Ptta/En/Spm, plant [Helianthus annuus]|nr:putative transposase, Ptta/En/Spm, plant [Helianthus annuus]
MGRSTAGGGRGQGGGGGQGGGRGNGTRNTENGGRPTSETCQLHDEPNDGDNDEWVVTVGCGPVLPAPLPTPENRIVLWVEKNQFNNHDDVSRTIRSNLKAMWLGPWQGWKDVPSHHHERLFERFQQYYQWKDEWKSQIHSCWEKCIKGKFPDLLKRAREKAKALACEEGIEVGDDLTRIIPFKPFWINQESWETVIAAWNTDSCKRKSSQNSDNRGKAVGVRHTLGSKSYVTVRKKHGEDIEAACYIW